MSPKLAQQLAERIADEVMAADWPVGSLLGTERELCERYGVSRNVLREAIRILEFQEVVFMREGAGGGLTVTAPTSASVAECAVVYLEGKGLTPGELFEARVIIESLAARLAAENATEATAGRLRTALELEETLEHRREPGVAVPDSLHMTIADLSGNPLIRLLEEVFQHITVHLFPRALFNERRNVIRTSHKKIAGAIQNGDADLAERYMVAHLTAAGAELDDA